MTTPSPTPSPTSQAFIVRLASYMRDRIAKGERFTYEADIEGVRVTHFDYTRSSMGWTRGAIMRRVQHVGRPSIDWVAKEAENWPELLPVDESISARLGGVRPPFRFWLRALIARLASVLESTDSPTAIDEVGTILAADVAGSATEWSITLWLYGLRLDVDTIRLTDGIVLRRPRPSDFEEGPISEDPYFLSRSSMPDAVIEANLTTEGGQVDLYRQITVVLDCLRLFKSCSLGVAEFSAVPRSFTELIGFPYQYRVDLVNAATLSEADAEGLPTFFSVLRPLVAAHAQTESARPSPLAIALHRFREALGENLDDAATAAAISGLEAQLLKGGETGELTFKLSHRAASLLRHFGLEPVALAKELSEAYSVRSKYVHGVHVKAANVRDLRDAALCACRRSLVASLQLEARHALPKDTLIDKLDEQMLSFSVGIELARHCETVSVP